MEFKHIPVLLSEVLTGLNIKKNGIYLDCTIGGAGHSFEILKSFNRGLLIGFDKDEAAIKASEEKLKNQCKLYTPENYVKKDEKACLLIKSDFKNAVNILNTLNISNIDGILIDLGISSYQIDTPSRGFSFRSEGELDMRMDTSQTLTAKEVVNTYSETQLKELFKNYGEEEFASSIASNIVKQRKIEEIKTTIELNQIVENSMPKKVVYSRGGAAKKVFQALRIEVNSELVKLEETLEDLIKLLKVGGRICVISFHSLEDRIVKTVFKNLSLSCVCPPNFPKCVCNHKQTVKLINKKPITSSEEELKNNSRSACAKLRIAEKV